MNFLDFSDFRIFSGMFTAPTGGSVGVPRCQSMRLYTRYDNKIKYTIFPKMFIFSMKHIFRKILKNRKFQKVTFSIFVEKLNIFKKVNIFRKHQHFPIFRKSQLFREKKTDFFEIDVFFQFFFMFF